ncbi:hypothetical protein Goarm_022479 [Gossypium armourianum]|uniref:Uncharacterized protein n=1 Tax=Gossypium armourianum TaxID=34283 RepID=A0A7J9KF12_9ROSI|nr:hypothetical protein [Gossypium armourianum]
MEKSWSKPCPYCFSKPRH